MTFHFKDLNVRNYIINIKTYIMSVSSTIMPEEQQHGTGIKTVNLDAPIYEKMVALIKKKYNKNVRRFVNDHVSSMLAREEMFERSRPFLWMIDTQDNSMYIKDERLNKVAEVTLNETENNKFLVQCNMEEDKDKSDYCVHVAFALGSNDLGKLRPKELIYKDENLEFSTSRNTSEQE